jgi:hypothetical protein
MHEGAPVTQWLLPRTGGLHRIHLSAPPMSLRRHGLPYSDRRIEHALNPASRRPREHAMSGHRTTSEAHPSPDTATDVVRWAVFSCVLVPVVLLWYGTSLAGAAGTALGLAAVTAACRVLLRRSEQGAARLLTEEPAPPLAEEHPPHRGHRHRAGRGRTGADGTPGEVHRSTDRFPRTRPTLFSQLPATAHPLPEPPPNPRSTCTERVWEGLRTLRGLATTTRRTSLHGPRVQRFVIECFTPSCHVDNVPVAELVTPAPLDTVDSILTSYGGGLVQDRGETCRSDTTEEPRPPRGA